MDGAILPLSTIRGADVSRAGGKGANLGELAAHGFPIPPAFVIAAPVSRLVFAHTGLDQEIATFDRGAVDEVSRRVQQRVMDGPLAESIGDLILDAYDRLLRDCGATLCVVRSSATAEDLAGASFAGQHGTYYYVDRAHLLEMVRRCWASLWSPEAIGYRTTHGVAHGSVSMAVVVQQMVMSDVSGVAFTVDPVSGARDRVVVESTWGMGAALVDGRVTPDRYLVARGTRALEQERVAEKRVMIDARAREGSHQRLIAVPPEMQRRPTLTAAQIAAIVDCSLDCERHFGSPQDVEWAIAGGRLYLLQSRPITTLDRTGTDTPAGRFVLFKAIAENFTGPLTPLTADLLKAASPPIIRMITGRPYFDLARVRPLLPIRATDQELADLLYLRGTPSVRLSLGRLPVPLVVTALTWLVIGSFLARTRGLPDDFMHGYRRRCADVEARPEVGPLEAFMQLWLTPRLLGPVGHMVLHVNSSFMRLVPWLLILKALLRRWVVEMPSEAVSLMCSGTDGVLSAQMGRDVAALAHEARATPAVAAILLQQKPARALVELRRSPDAAAFLASLDRFLSMHGHRALREFELQSPRWSENPVPVLAMIRNYVAAPVDAVLDHNKAKHARGELEGVVQGALGGSALERLLPVRWWMIRAAASRARYYLKLRENSRFYHIMGLATVRRKILAVEDALLRQGRLKCRDDIFYLRVREMQALEAGRLQWADVEERIRQRRIEHLRFSKMTPPITIGIAPQTHEAPQAHEAPQSQEAPQAHEAPPALQAPQAPQAPCLSGQSASPGKFTGRARVILDPAVDATLEPGEVLIAPYTDPAWTPLFLTAGAAVVEVGSYLSHAGTVAREFGMPCVVDVPDCTRHITTGMLVEVDADAGIVRMLGEARVG